MPETQLTPAGETPQTSETEPINYDSWIATQPDETRALVESHAAGLKRALESEREQRKALDRDLKAAIKAAGDNAEVKTALTQYQQQVAAVEQQMAGYEALYAAGASNVKLAWLAAQADGLVTDDGVQVQKLKDAYPELFAKRTVPPGNAGNGAGQEPTGKTDMNVLIRARAGR